MKHIGKILVVALLCATTFVQAEVSVQEKINNKLEHYIAPENQAKFLELDAFLIHNGAPEQRALMNEIDKNIVLLARTYLNFFDNLIISNEDLILEIGQICSEDNPAHIDRALELTGTCFALGDVFNAVVKCANDKGMAAVDTRTFTTSGQYICFFEELVACSCAISECLARACGESKQRVSLHPLSSDESNEIIKTFSDQFNALTLQSQLLLKKIVRPLNDCMQQAKEMQLTLFDKSLYFLDMMKLQQQIDFDSVILQFFAHRVNTLQRRYEFNEELLKLTQEYNEFNRIFNKPKQEDIMQLLHMCKRAMKMTQEYLETVLQKLDTVETQIAVLS
ncbi:MAG: hypothetical protein AB7F19_04530 [Candidatus Babeliales bacterium]